MNANTQLKVAPDAPDELTLAAAAVSEAERRLSERREKLRQIQARRQAVEAEIKTSSLEGDVAALGGLSSERAQLADAETALTVYSIPPLEAALRSAQTKCGDLHRARTIDRRAADRVRNLAALEAHKGQIPRTFADLVAALKSWAQIVAALEPGPGEVAPYIGWKVLKIGLSPDDVAVIRDGLVTYEAMLKAELDQSRRRDFEATAERNRQRLEAANAPPPLDETPQIVQRWV
jgi:hypothetical protein